LTDLTDTVISNTQNYQSLQWNGTEWVNSYPSIQHLSDIDRLNNPSDGDTLQWNANNNQYEYVQAFSGLANIIEDTTPQLGGNLDAQAFDITTTGKIRYSNVFSLESDLPAASTYHGMFAHVHSTGKAYYAHAGNWVRLADYSEIGVAGEKGDTGDTGPAGPQGEQGVAGSDGIDGQNGTDGADGASAYEVAVSNGVVGTETEWLDSLVGPAGADGSLSTIVTERALFEAGIIEGVSTIDAAGSGPHTIDCSASSIFTMYNMSADFTITITNPGHSNVTGALQSDEAVMITLHLIQGATAYMPTSVQLNGSSMTILWQGGEVPTGTANGVDMVSFVMIGPRVNGNANIPLSLLGYSVSYSI
jgi:hypothetical protein